MKIFLIALLLLVQPRASFASFMIPSAESVQIANPEIRTEWLDEKGEVLGDFEALVETRWVRRERNGALGDGGPAAVLGVRVWLLVPRAEWSEYSLPSVAGVSQSEDFSLPEKIGTINPKTERLIVLDVDDPDKRIPFRRTDFKGKVSEVSLRISLESDEPVFWVDSTCTERGYVILGDTAGAEGEKGRWVAGAVCEEEGKETRLWIIHSAVARANARNGEKQAGSGTGWTAYRLRLPGPGESPFLVELARGGRVAAQWAFSAGARETDTSPWVLGLSGGVSSIAYREVISSEVRISELVATVRGSTYYWLAPGRIDLGANGFFNLLPIGTGTGVHPATRFYGLNFRAGYYPAASWGGMHFGLMGGWYVWGNITSDSSYGLKSLGGPQFMVSARTTAFGGRPVFGFVRVAPIFGQSGDRINLSNREVSFGGGIQLSAPSRDRAWSVTLDVSQIQYGSATHFGTSGASMELFSVGAGLGVTFF